MNTSAEDPRRRNRVKPSGIDATDLELAEIDDIEALKQNQYRLCMNKHNIKREMTLLS